MAQFNFKAGKIINGTSCFINGGVERLGDLVHLTYGAISAALPNTVQAHQDTFVQGSDSDPEERPGFQRFFELVSFLLGSVLCDLPKLIALITVHFLCHLSSHECVTTEDRLNH